jgi:hypothetical protein
LSCSHFAFNISSFVRFACKRAPSSSFTLKHHSGQSEHNSGQTEHTVRPERQRPRLLGMLHTTCYIYVTPLVHVYH